jgi:hypothetical protein
MLSYSMISIDIAPEITNWKFVEVDTNPKPAARRAACMAAADDFILLHGGVQV